MIRFQVRGDPHPWPRDGTTVSSRCALLVVDMQADYCLPGYYMDRAGYDTRRLSEPIGRIQHVVTAARRAGMHVVYTRHARAPHSHPGATAGQAPGAATSVVARTAARGEPGWQIVPALRPHVDDPVVDKSTISAFASGELDLLLQRQQIRHLAICGNTIDVCVHSTLRAAVDLGYECLLLADCCAAVNDRLHAWSIEAVTVENGVFGSVTTANAFLEALSQPSHSQPS